VVDSVLNFVRGVNTKQFIISIIQAFTTAENVPFASPPGSTTEMFMMYVTNR